MGPFTCHVDHLQLYDWCIYAMVTCILLCGFSLKKNIPTTMYEDWRHHHKKLSDVLIRGSIIRVALFFPWARFFPTGRFLMRQQIVHIKRYVHSFSFTRIFSYRVFPSKVLTRHIIYGNPRGSIINPLNCVDCPLDILKT